jgi:hypothetical protein
MLNRTTLLSALAICLTLVGTALAERGDDADRKSKNGYAAATVDGVEVVIEYGRPNANDRAIWGGLVPFGEVWRTGANEATTISFSQDVMVEGAAVAAGTYGLFTVPNEEECEIRVNSKADQWGAFEYDSSLDVAAVTVPFAPVDFVETFTITVGENAVTLAWADRAATFRVAAAG